MADEVVERAKKQLEEDRKVRAQSDAEYAERMKGKPTPTQEENDMAILGGFVTGSTHEEDGSGPDPFNKPQHHVRQSEADKSTSKPASYSTRHATAAKSE